MIIIGQFLVGRMFQRVCVFKTTISKIIFFSTLILVVWWNWQFLANHVSEAELEELAQAVTVRVFSEDNSLGRGGSGVLIRREGKQYTVVTNHHVLSNSSLHYQVQTTNGSFYPAEILAFSKSENDLALLTFDSPDRSYRVLSLQAEVRGKIGDSILVGGFPFNDNLTQSPKCLLTQGEIVMILPRALVGGYQIGYTNVLRNGMSGGPLLNQDGELIGIHGLGKNPIFGNPYVFKDGSSVSEAEWQKMNRLSWGIPVQYMIQDFQS